MEKIHVHENMRVFVSFKHESTKTCMLSMQMPTLTPHDIIMVKGLLRAFTVSLHLPPILLANTDGLVEIINYFVTYMYMYFDRVTA